MKVIFKKRLGEKTTNIMEVVEAALIENENAICCLGTDHEDMVKFVPNKNIKKWMVTKAFNDLLTIGYHNFTKWDTYAKYHVEETNEDGWMKISKTKNTK